MMTCLMEQKNQKGGVIEKAWLARIVEILAASMCKYLRPMKFDLIKKYPWPKTPGPEAKKGGNYEKDICGSGDVGVRCCNDK
jgi:hypothetical protein